jgi:hypothetical protein
MNLIEFGKLLGNVLPKIKGVFQLSGLVVCLAFGLAVHFARPGDNIALLTAGSTGILIIIFGQLFHFLRTFRERDRPLVFLVSFSLFCIFEIALLVIFIVLVRQPTMSIGPYSPTPAENKASHSQLESTKGGPAQPNEVRDVATGSEDIASGGFLTIPDGSSDALEEATSRDADYAYSEPNGIPTLRASLKYSIASRKGSFPDGDFHEGVSFGSPWLSLDINNPSNQNLYLTMLSVKATSIEPINEFIPDAPEIDGATPKKAQLTIVNEGWGTASKPTLSIWYARAIDHGRHQILGHTSQALPDFNDTATVDLVPSMPPTSTWTKSKHSDKGDAYIELLCKLQYSDEKGDHKVETFRTVMYSTFGGGGNVFPQVYFNVTLPTEMNEYPIDVHLSNCISASSAGEFVVRLRAKRSARFRLELTLSSTSGMTIKRTVDADILVARHELVSSQRDGTFLKDGSKGCT